MNVSREEVSLALFGLFTPMRTPAGPFVTVSRNYPSKANAEDPFSQPSVYVVEDNENDDQSQEYGMDRYKLTYKILLFAQNPDPNTAPGTILNPLMDLIDTALHTSLDGFPLHGNFQTLSASGDRPLVANCWIDGRVFKACGHLGNQTYAIFPVSILTGI